MKKKSIKSAFAIACVAVASVSGIKAYNVANQSQTNMLLMENVEALSQSNEVGDCIDSECDFGGYGTCYYHCGSIVGVCAGAYNKFL